jgi:hypothetical protein
MGIPSKNSLFFRPGLIAIGGARVDAMRVMVRAIQVFLMLATPTFGIAAVVAWAHADDTGNTCVRLEDAGDPLGCATDLNEPGRAAAGPLFAVISVAMGVCAVAMSIVARRRAAVP